MKLRKILSVILSAVCINSCISVTVNAEELTQNDIQYTAKDYNESDVKTTDDGLKYVIRDNSIEITGCESYVSDPVIPAEIDGIPVTAIGSNAFEFKYLSTFALKSITLPDTIVSIGDNAFKGSYDMTTLTIPKSVQYIGVGINAGSYEFAEIKVDKDNPYFTAVDGVLYNKDMTTLVEFPCAKDVKSYTVPDSVTEIYGEAFDGCTRLEKIDLHDGITKIGINAFRDCSSLKDFDIPDNLKEIPSGMLRGCSSITEITIPYGVETVGGAFSFCTNLKTVSIPDSVTSIGNQAFYECTNLESITFPDSITTLGYGMFIRCFSLEFIKLPAGITEIPSEMCAGCSELKSIEIPQKVKTIRNSAFYGSALESITIPDSVEVIEYAAFQGCRDLAEINVSESHVFSHLGDCAFGYGSGLSTTKWYVDQPDGCVYIGKNLYRYKGDISKEDIITIKEGTVTICASAFRDQENLKNIELPESILYINDIAFDHCKSLNNIELPGNIEIIEKGVFQNSGLTEITIPASTKSIGGTAFYECKNLKSFTIYSFDCILCAKPYAPQEMLPESTVIFGYAGSTAEEYAKEYNRTFELIDDIACDVIPAPTQAATKPETTTTAPAQAATKPATLTTTSTQPVTKPAMASMSPVQTATKPVVTSCAVVTVIVTETTIKDGMENDGWGDVAYEPAGDVPVSDIVITVPDGAVADMYGDANNDNEINISDAVLINLLLLDPVEYKMNNDTAIANSDCYRDNKIDSADSALLLNYITMMISYDVLGA